MSDETKNQLVKIGAQVATVLAVILGVLCFVGAVAYAAYSVFHLFSEVVKVTPFEAGAAALSSVGLAVGSLFIIVASRHNYNLRAMGAIVLLFGVLITLPLVAVDASLRTAVLTNIDALINIGRVIAAILPALALAAVVALVLSMNDTTPHKSAAAAIAKYVGFAAKFVAIGASIFASAYFGMSRGIDPVLAVLCGALLESAFLWSYFALKKAREAQDGFDVVLWSVAVLTFGAFIAAVSVETLSSLAKIDVPVVAALGEVGASLYVSAVGLSLVLTVITHLLTQAIDMPAHDGALTVKQPAASRIANAIRGAKAGAGEVRTALTGDKTAAPQLPAGTTATMASEHKPTTKMSETGVPYDTTGEVAREDWPNDDERRRVLDELQRRKEGAEAKK